MTVTPQLRNLIKKLPYIECSDSFKILDLGVLGLAVSHINESNCKLMSPEHYF